MADTLKSGPLKFLEQQAPDQPNTKGQPAQGSALLRLCLPGTWHELEFRVTTTHFESSSLPGESSDAAQGKRCPPVPIDQITAVRVYLGWRFDVTRRNSPTLNLIVNGGSVAAWEWADAIHAARIDMQPDEAYRLRNFFRPCIQVADGRNRESIDMRRLMAQLSRIGEEFSESQLSGLVLGPDLKVVCEPQARYVLKAITNKVVNTEVIEVWENGRVDGALLENGDPPGFQRGDGSALSSAEMVRGLHDSWYWLCDWEVISSHLWHICCNMDSYK